MIDVIITSVSSQLNPEHSFQPPPTFQPFRSSAQTSAGSAPWTYRAPQVCRQNLLPVHVLLESPPGLLQRGFVSRLPQLPQNQTSQQSVQVTCSHSVPLRYRRAAETFNQILSGPCPRSPSPGLLSQPSLRPMGVKRSRMNSWISSGKSVWDSSEDSTPRLQLRSLHTV